MTAGLCETIRAGVVFEIKSFRPVWFSMGGLKIVIKDVCYQWKERRAGEVFYKFTVTDGMQFYELEFASRQMEWKLTATE